MKGCYYKVFQGARDADADGQAKSKSNKVRRQGQLDKENNKN